VTLEDVLDHFHTTKSGMAEILGCTPGAITQWEGKIPMGRQWQIEAKTKGKLKADKQSAKAA